MKIKLGTLKRVIKESLEPGGLTAEIHYNMYGSSAYLSDGRTLDLFEIAEQLMSYEEYTDAHGDQGDEEWGYFQQTVAQVALEAAGVTEVNDSEMPDGPCSIEEYAGMLQPMTDPELIQLLNDSQSTIKSFVDGATKN